MSSHSSHRLALITGFLLCAQCASAFEEAIEPLLTSTCFACHSDTTLTPLNIKEVSFDLTDAETYRTWKRIYDRLERGQMPPPPMAESEAIRQMIDAALPPMKEALVAANQALRGDNRMALRRLTRLEYAYTLRDLLHIDEEVAIELSSALPAEADTGGFDTVAARQGISALHVRSYLQTADDALEEAILVGARPPTKTFKIDYAKSPYLNRMSEAKILGGGVTKMVDDAAVMFFDSGSTYLMHSDSEGFRVKVPGRYQITADAYPYQADTPVTLMLFRGTKQGVTASLDDLIGSFDLLDRDGRVVEVTTYLGSGQLISPSLAEVDRPQGDYVNYFAPDQNVKTYAGEGIAMRSITIEGPLIDQWPPQSTRDLLIGIDFDENGEVKLTKSAYEHVYDIVDRFATLAFRRPLAAQEVEAFANLARPALADERPFLDAVKVPLRAILSAPPFLYQGGDTQLDDFGFASRLSYFLWRSMPDEELFEAARKGRLGDPRTLSAQIDRMLDDPKHQRFVKDFAGQAFRLYELKSTSPDGQLYPEYDERLGQAMEFETHMFLEELIAQNMGLGNLIDSDFTFLNRRLAEHYDVPEVAGQHMRKVTLPADSVRGGLLTQASVHKITANGTTTSPVPRGNFVLTNVLGRPSPPPPANVSGLEPDTRGTTTIREQLTAHRANPTCAGCHRTIDPPGFALESFDPIGGYRDDYRKAATVNFYPTYDKGLPVDPSGVTPEGWSFGGIEEYKNILLEYELKHIARHITSQRVVFGTGADVDFADRDAVDEIVSVLSEQGYPMRTMIHEVAQSDLFRRR